MAFVPGKGFAPATPAWGVITLTTDFGTGSYVAAMKGVILRIHPEARVVDLSHAVRHGDVRHGAFLLASVLPYYPHAVHVAVVDPGVGAGRRGLAVECEAGVLVGPDNGVLMPAARKLGLKRVVELRNPDYWLSPVSSTFHGRDVFAPVAAHLDMGVSVPDLGPEVANAAEMDFGQAVVEGEKITGEVILADHFGNVVTNIPAEVAEALLRLGDRVRMTCREQRIEVSFVPSYGFVKLGEPLLLAGSSGYLEVAVNQGSAKDLLAAVPGDRVSLERL